MRVVLAHNRATATDPRIEPLVHELGDLKYTAYELKQQQAIALSPNVTSRMQLPNGMALLITLQPVSEEAMMRLELSVKELKLKTLVALAPGATLAIGGPPYNGGVLILALTRPNPKAMPGT